MTILSRTDTPPLAACVVAVFFIGAVPAQAACEFELQGEGRVAAALDARTLRLDDGREVRLAGIEPPAQSDARALENLALGRDVTLHGISDTPDRYGRQQAFVFVYGDDQALQNQLLAQGVALASGSNLPDKDCAMELTASESAARSAGRGLWGSPAAIKNAESTADILAEIGRFTLVEGKVVSARQAGAIFYVNFGRRWIRDFAVTVSRRMMPTVEAGGVRLATLENRRIRVRGFVERRGGAPRIEVVAPGQIELINENGAAVAGKSE